MSDLLIVFLVAVLAVLAPPLAVASLVGWGAAFVVAAAELVGLAVLLVAVAGLLDDDPARPVPSG